LRGWLFVRGRQRRNSYDCVDLAKFVCAIRGWLFYSDARIAVMRIPDVAMEEGEACDEILSNGSDLAKFLPSLPGHS